MPMERYEITEHPWSLAARRQLRRALDDLESGRDALPAVSAALSSLRIEAGEIPEDRGLLNPEPWCNHDTPAVRNGVCECGTVVDPDDIACGELDQDGYAGLPSTGDYSAGRD